MSNVAPALDNPHEELPVSTTRSCSAFFPGVEGGALKDLACDEIPLDWAAAQSLS